MKKLKQSEESTLENISFNVSPDFFKDNQFIMGSVNTKSFILLIAQNSPRSFISGSIVSLSNVLKDYNRNEFHHIFPRAFLRTLENKNYGENTLANFCFLSRADNQRLGGNKPSVYRTEMPTDIDLIMDSALCSDDLLFGDDFNGFINDRATKLFDFLIDKTN